MIPKEFGGAAVLENFKYRDALLSVHVEGYGRSVKSITMDGEPLPAALMPADTQGKHAIQIVMANDDLSHGGQHLSDAATSPETPVLNRDTAILHWNSVADAVSYVVVRNGARIAETKNTSFTLPVTSGYAEYQVSAVDKNGSHSFLSQPLPADDSPGIIVEAESAAAASTAKLKDFTGEGFVELSRTNNRSITLHAAVPESGTYAIDFRYSNGSGPINTDNKCALRSLAVDGKPESAVVFPQRGKDEWAKWGYSSRQQIVLTAGEHEFRLQFEPSDENMNREVNRALSIISGLSASTTRRPQF